MAGLNPSRTILVNAADLVANLPSFLSDVIDAEALEDLWLVPLTTSNSGTTFRGSSGIAIDHPIIASLPALDAVQLMVGKEGDPTIFRLQVTIDTKLTVSIGEVPLALRFASGYFKPARLDTETGAYEVDDTKTFAEIDLGVASLSFDGDGGISLSLSGGVGFPPLMIGDTGVAVTGDGIQIFLDDSASPPGQPAGTRGLSITSAKLFLPGNLGRSVTLTIGTAFIGNGGFSGSVTTTISPAVDEDFGGLRVGLNSVALTFVQNALTATALTGTMLVPYFDKRVIVSLAVGLNGDVTLAVTGVVPGDGAYDPATGILTLAAGPLTFNLTRFSIELHDGKAAIHASGQVHPEIADVSFPTFSIDDFSIDSQGRLSLSGGWIDLADQLTVDLYGFLLEITRIGFGKTDEGDNWIGFNGSLKLLEGVPAGASVEGMRILWGGPRGTDLTVEGIGVELEIPNVLRISGKVSLAKPEFKGAVRVELPAISFEVDGQFVAGTVVDINGDPVLDPDTGRPLKTYAVYVQMQLPAGVPLGPTGLAFYGFAGLYAYNREPDKHADEGWYRGPNLEDGWYTRSPAGITDVGQKWRGAKGHTGFGAGIIIGTFPDNGYTFNGRLLLALVFPGPVILIEGMANLFKKRSALGDGSEPNFRALLVIDPGKSFTAGLDAQYKFADGGELLEIRGSAETFFDYTGNWFIHIGVRDPASRRIRARAFRLFDVNAFFMLDPTKLTVGAGWSLHKVYGFKHLNVTLSASMGGEATLSWHPAHLNGTISVAGSAELRAFGIGAGLSVSATVSADVFDPFGLSGRFRAGINLPWPLPDIHVTVQISWSESSTPPPPLPVPTREASIEHIKSHNSWPLLGGSSLFGNLDFELPGSDDLTPIGPTSELSGPLPAGQVPSIPADAKVALTFTRPVQDPNKICIFLADVQPEKIGDRDKDRVTYTVAYSLENLDLQKWSPTDPATTATGEPKWVTVRKGITTDGTSQLAATWQPGADKPDENYSEQNKLFVNAVTPFDYTAERSKAWQDWFLSTHPGFPCPLAVPELSGRFTQEIGTNLNFEKPVVFDEPAFSVDWVYGGYVGANDVVTSTILGPIDRGLVAAWTTSSITEHNDDFIFEVTPLSGDDDILIRLGTPAVLFRQSSGFSAPDPEAPPPPNPIVLGVDLSLQTFTGLGTNPTPKATNTLTHFDDLGHGLEVGDRLEIFPPQAALYVDFVLAVTTTVGTSTFEAFTVDTNGTEGAHQDVAVGKSTLHLRCSETALIAKVVVRRKFKVGGLGGAIDPRLYIFKAASRGLVLARAFAPGGVTQDFEEPLNGLLHVQLPGLTKVRVFGQAYEGITLLEVALPADNDELVRHVQSSLSRLKTDDPLFEPENDYRLIVTTKRHADGGPGRPETLTSTTNFVHHVYFHVAGPPGIGAPPDQPPEQTAGDTGLGDLRLYVEQTLPPTIPAVGDKLLLPRAFYRGYDVAVHFNENYTELMYLLARRALTTRLYDVNDAPVLRPDGRVSIPTPSWERSRIQELNEAVTAWVGLVNGSDCHPADLPPVSEDDVSRPQVLSAPGDEVVLAPETLYQARLVPALLHEAFLDPVPNLIANGSQYRLDRWVAENFGSSTPNWKIDSAEIPGVLGPDGEPAMVFFATESTTTAASSLFYAGPLNLADGNDAPTHWSNFRASVRLRWASGIVGFELRRASGGDMIRLTLNRTGDARNLVGVVGGVPTPLGPEVNTPAFPSDPGNDIVLTVECVDDHVLVLQEGVDAPLFDVPDAPTASGTIGLYVENAAGVRFTEVHVDDLRTGPATAFTFDFVTSKYVNFYDHMHSFADRIFDGAPNLALSAADLSAAAAASVALPAPSGVLGAVPDAERRAFDVVETKSLGSAALAPAESLEILRVSEPGAPVALMVRSPEPVLWERVQLEISSAGDATPFDLPGDLKLSDVAFGAGFDGQVATILVRSSSNLSQHRLQWRPLPTSTDPDPAWTDYFTFGVGEVDVADGTRVLILPPVPDGEDPPEREPGTLQRFLPSTATPATLTFAAPGVELRLVAPDGDVVHQRRFSTPEAYTAFPMLAVRKLDGTAALLFVTGGSAPPALRLRWTFTRAFPDEALAYRQGGSELPEVAVLDLTLP